MVEKKDSVNDSDFRNHPDFRRRMVLRAMQKLVMAKGKDYYLYLKVLAMYLGDELEAAVNALRETKADGLLSYADMCDLLVQFEFPAHRMKSMLSILEDRRAIAIGQGDRLTKQFGVKKSLMQLGYEKCPNPDCWRWYRDVCQCQEDFDHSDTVKKR